MNLSPHGMFEEKFKSNFKKYGKYEIDIQSLVEERPSSIIYCAQSRKYKEYPQGIPDLTQLNIVLPLKLSEIANELGIPFVYCSTGSIYRNTTEVIHEHSELAESKDFNPYIASKLFTDQTLQERISSDNILILRPFYIFGQGSKVPSLFPSLINEIKNNAIINLIGPNGIMINPLYSRDAARAIIHLLTNDLKGTFNLAGPEVVSLKQISILIANELKTFPRFQEVAGSLSVVSSQEKLMSTGFSFHSSFHESFKSYVAKSLPS